MVNKREMEVMNEYQQKGWKAVRGGAPDWLFIKTNKGDINDIEFVEVKSQNDKLKIEQHIWRKVLKQLGCKYKVIIIN